MKPQFPESEWTLDQLQRYAAQLQQYAFDQFQLALKAKAVAQEASRAFVQKLNQEQ